MVAKRFCFDHASLGVTVRERTFGGRARAVVPASNRARISFCSCFRRIPLEGSMARVLGINAVFHDPAAALVVDGEIVAAAEEERFSRRKHGKRPVPFAAWEQPEQSAAWCLAEGGLQAEDLDLVGYSYDPGLVDHSLDG